ncbi:MAG: AAA family ATPase [Armatimonadetes bacterium]|nr:AAA family ATPase [Armatimonadota bacterium]
MDALHEIEVLIRAKYPIVYIVSWEEGRVEAALQEVAKKLGRNLHTWSKTQGMKPKVNRAVLSGGGSAPPKTTLPGEIEALALVLEAPEGTMFLLKDFHAYMKSSDVVRLLRDVAAQLRRGEKRTLFILAPTMTLPVELEKDVSVLEFPLPDQDAIKAQVATVATSVTDPSVNVKLSPDEEEAIVRSAQGLTHDEIESALARSLVEKRQLCVDQILEEKKQIVRKTGMLQFYPAENDLGDVGGLDLLKQWLERREKSFTDAAREFGIPYPKGVLLIGVQGCGKSLVAKAISAAYGLPMLKMDVGRVFGSLVGQSEDNMRRAIRIAESLAPCILWIDELEKGFAGMSGSGISDGGTTARVFSTFLTWMQEKTKPVFIVATANDVSALPPELLRKGRFDEIFFLDLPESDDRKQIFNIHLSKRKRDPKKFKVADLAKQTEGFSGAEIEQVVIGALNRAFDEGRELSTADLSEEAKTQVPLSRTMAEDISALRSWAKVRARPSATSKAASAKN